MDGALDDALIEAGASAPKARGAAESVASVDSRMIKTEVSLSDFRAEVGQRFTKVEAELALLKWMVGFTLASVVAMMVKLFSM